MSEASCLLMQHYQTCSVSSFAQCFEVSPQDNASLCVDSGSCTHNIAQVQLKESQPVWLAVRKRSHTVQALLPASCNHSSSNTLRAHSSNAAVAQHVQVHLLRNKIEHLR
jgi:hypothetical protein